MPDTKVQGLWIIHEKVKKKLMYSRRVNSDLRQSHFNSVIQSKEKKYQFIVHY